MKLIMLIFSRTQSKIRNIVTWRCAIIDSETGQSHTPISTFSLVQYVGGVW